MLGSALSALSDRLDSRFLIAFWLPAFVLVLGGIGIMTALVGPSLLEHWALTLGPVAQSLVTILLVLFITILACVLRALTWPIAATYAGDALPKQSLAGRRVASSAPGPARCWRCALRQRRRRSRPPDGGPDSA